MEYGFAPMEGITTAPFRRVHRQVFGGVARYYTPFLSATQVHQWKTRDLREVVPFEENLVPQVLAGKAEDFIWAALSLKELGYFEVNLNMGCPMPMVVTKGRGCGLIQDLSRLRSFFDEVFAAKDLPAISVKTRLGFSSVDEAEALGECLNEYPFCEVIIHARTREQLYGGEVHTDVFKRMKDRLSCRVCYNGDVFTREDTERIRELFPDVETIMIGRGLLRNPALGRELLSGKAAEPEEIQRFTEELVKAYREVYSGEKDILFKMKELWTHFGLLYADRQEGLKKIRKAKTMAEYREGVRQVLCTG